MSEYSIRHTDQWDGALIAVVSKSWEIILIGIFTLVASLNMMYLCGYHVFLISIGQTWAERSHRVYEGIDNPFDKGCALNCVNAVCFKIKDNGDGGGSGGCVKRNGGVRVRGVSDSDINAVFGSRSPNPIVGHAGPPPTSPTKNSERDTHAHDEHDPNDVYTVMSV